MDDAEELVPEPWPLRDRDPERRLDTSDRADDSRSTTARPAERLSGMTGTRVVDRPPPISGEVVVPEEEVSVKGVVGASAEEPEDAIVATRVGKRCHTSQPYQYG